MAGNIAGNVTGNRFNPARRREQGDADIPYTFPVPAGNMASSMPSNKPGSMPGRMTGIMTDNMAGNSSNAAPRRQQGKADISYASAVSRAAQLCDERLAADVRNVSAYALGVHRYGVHNRAANTPFGYQFPAHEIRLERQAEEKSPFTAWGSGAGTWMGVPDQLTASDDLSWPETVAKTSAGFDWDWTEYLDPQLVLNEHNGCAKCHGSNTIPGAPGCELSKCGLGNAMHEPYMKKSKPGNPGDLTNQRSRLNNVQART